jgi:PAT family beta-lactamase induction signal transducer AmpG
MIFILYVAQGVPVGFFYIAVPAWLAASGASAAAVGTVLGATSLPWTLKFLNGFLMERYPYLPMGRRRAWLIGAQLTMATFLFAMAALAPGPHDTALLATLSFLVMTATTFQDIAIDAMAVDLLQDDERARANGLMFGGQAIGSGIAGTAAGFGIGRIGIGGVAALAGVALLLLILLVVLCRERPGERLLPWTAGRASAACEAAHLGAWGPMLRETWRAMTMRISLLCMLPMLCAGLYGGFYVGANPLLAVRAAGWSQERIATFSSVGSFCAGLLVAVIASPLVGRLGYRRAIQLVFALVALAGLAMLAAQPLWAQGWPVAALILVSDPLNFTLAACLGAVAMRLCNPAVAATQFTLYMATNNLGRSLGSWVLGSTDAIGGTTALVAGWVVIGLAGLLAARIALEADPSQRPD